MGIKECFGFLDCWDLVCWCCFCCFVFGFWEELGVEEGGFLRFLVEIVLGWMVVGGFLFGERDVGGLFVLWVGMLEDGFGVIEWVGRGWCSNRRLFIIICVLGRVRGLGLMSGDIM